MNTITRLLMCSALALTGCTDVHLSREAVLIKNGTTELTPVPNDPACPYRFIGRTKDGSVYYYEVSAMPVGGDPRSPDLQKLVRPYLLFGPQNDTSLPESFESR